MDCYDVFNGDADGICALVQWRLAFPVDAAILVTGVKRDNALLARVQPKEPAAICVFDISLARNAADVDRLLAGGSAVHYFDHHAADGIPEHPRLDAHIDPAPDTCTALIVHRHLGGGYPLWALVGAFGDNLHENALSVARDAGLDALETACLREAGELVTYNSYGFSENDLQYHPAELYREMTRYGDDALAFMRLSRAPALLRQNLAADWKAAEEIAPRLNAGGRVYQLPDEPWARRIAGIFINAKSRERPELAHCLLVAHPAGGWRVSVRSPLAGGPGAADFCRCFPSGGGRLRAAGINCLAAGRLEEFLAAFSRYFGAPAA